MADGSQWLCAATDYQRNVRWQTVADATVKDREERMMCRRVMRLYELIAEWLISHVLHADLGRKEYYKAT